MVIRKISSEILNMEKADRVRELGDFEKMLAKRSLLSSLFIKSRIDKVRDEIRAIDAELALREKEIK